MTINTKTAILPLLAATVLLGAGCNPLASVQQKATDAVVEKVVESQTGQKVNVDSNGATVSYQGQNGGGTIQVANGTQYPENFPAEIPHYPGAADVSVITMQADSVFMVSLRSLDDADTVANWFEDSLTKDGFTKTSEEPSIFMRMYEKGNIKMSVQARYSEKKALTDVNIQLSKGN
ncbi:hypothetical protein COX00_00060 [Candidatus Uhrbacteria bacterium CG22_combo_CG10-13_8_21_14_all_47_17]|uniref:Lipoprotein n=1 Tax=Candidatus Uhrbacteria bacterium CG22_combo_CG10-13_8_21_14_all_47_17 TaxID=1975041 RepID=A0A2H0BTL8_9BACT|nr:MAG: hypothetical protein COX00_00060 [Candidatus Uhrbacteria bacterium CG22_combo_CG10-13_8_21_14_all_47_17]